MIITRRIYGCLLVDTLMGISKHSSFFSYGVHCYIFSYPFDGPGLILAHAYYPYEFGDLGGDIHFDEDEDWRVNVTETWSGMDFFTVAQHEIGHSLGLSHSPVSDSVMYPYYKGKQGNQGVGYDDVLAMYELYSE